MNPILFFTAVIPTLYDDLCVCTCIHLIELSLLCEQGVKQFYKNVEEEPPVYFYIDYEADVIGVNCERSTWPLENSEPAHQV